MNDFIKLRMDYLKYIAKNSFPRDYLEKLKATQQFGQKENELIDQLHYLFQLQQKKEITQNTMIDLLSYLGTNDYINRYIVTLLIQNQQLFNDAEFVNRIHQLVSKKTIADAAIYALLDCCIECDYKLFDREVLEAFLSKDTLSLDTFTLIIDYLHHFRIDGFLEEIYKWLQEDYPIVIKIQLIDLLIELYSLRNLSLPIVLSKNDQVAMERYLEIITMDMNYRKVGFTVLQSMFYGDFEQSGKGNNGGLAVFLKNLGTELSKSEEIAQVITLAITNQWSSDQSLVSEYSNNHLFINIPMYIDKLNPTEFLKKEHFIKRTVARFLNRLALEPDIYHVRFLDNASKAIAQLSEEQNKKLVVTLTPDPHRNMTNQTGTFNSFSLSELIEKLNKIIIGDELILSSDKIVGIGNHIVKKELEQYFPQLIEAENQSKIHMISEGIQTDISLMRKNKKSITEEELDEMGLTECFFKKPIILNVGRLNKLKAQDQLLKAWGNSKLSEIYNLLIIGGDLESPDQAEKEVLNIFQEYLKENPALKEKFLHLGALANYRIRKLEKKIRAEQKKYPQIYLCSSQKEEFGIAILEALSQRLLVIAPEKGGVKSYLDDGVNGFLIDTTNWQTIAKATEEIIDSLVNSPKTFEQIQEAGEKTVKENFSLAVIAKDFSSLYLSLQEKE